MEKRWLGVVFGMAALACTDSETAPEGIGAALLEARTSGGDPDLDGYIVVFDGVSAYSLAPNGAVVIPRLLAGGHRVTFGEIDPNCQSRSAVARSVWVGAGDTSRVSFEVFCEATGIRVGTVVSGVDRDSQFHILVNDALRPEVVGPDGTQEVTRLAAGSYTVRLGDVAPNCEVTPASQTALVSSRSLTPVTFSARCTAVSGTIRIMVHGTGEDLDQSGYEGFVDTGAGGVGAPGTSLVMIPGVSPGPRMVSLTGVAPNCAVEGDNPRPVTVRAGTEVRDTVEATFAVRCVRTWALALVRGGRVALASGDGAVVDLLGGGGRPAWSPDGRYLGYDCGGICITDLNGAGTTRILFGEATVEGVDWRRDGQLLVFTLYQCSGWYDYDCTFQGLKLLPPAGGTLTGVPLPAEVRWASGAAWSPDGSTIAFNCDIGAVTVTKICSVGGDGTGFKQLTTGDGYDTDPAWSPDGRRIAFASFRSGSLALMVMNADGSGAEPLGPAIHGRYPAWSPDGSRILYVSSLTTTGLYSIKLDGSGQVRLTNVSGDIWPAWRP